MKAQKKQQNLQNLASLNNRHISYAELKKHGDYTDAWIAVDGIVYDITDFIEKHPFGDTFRGTLGTDCSGLFFSAHIRTNAEKLLNNHTYQQKHGIKVVGQLNVSNDVLKKDGSQRHLDRIVYQKLAQDEFWQDLKQRVRAYLEESNESIHYSTRTSIFYLLYHGGLFAVLSYLTWFNHSFLAAIALGFHLMCASASLSHMVAHFGFTKNPLICYLALQFMDLSGVSWLEWQIVHQTHHNQPHSSIDYQTNQYEPVRVHRYVQHQKYHQYQSIWFWIGILFYQLRGLIMSSVWLIQYRQYVRHKYEVFSHILAKSVLISFIVYAGYLHGVGQAVLLFATYSISFSFFAFIFLYNDHEENHNILAIDKDINIHHQQKSWAEIQVRTSGDWYPTNWFLSFVEFHYGYFNYHIEHHLFPSFKPLLLKKVSPIVKEVCADHDIPYISTTFLELQQSFQTHISKLAVELET